jgi:transposase-like protein
MIISDACRGLTKSTAEYLPDACWQRCMVQMCSAMRQPSGSARSATCSRPFTPRETREAADRKASSVIDVSRQARMGAAAELVESGVQET